MDAREKAIEALEGIKSLASSYLERKPSFDMTTIKTWSEEALAALEDDGWISVSERLPESEGGRARIILGYKKDKGVIVTNDFAIRETSTHLYTHWRTLPPPPKEQTDAES